MTMAASKLEGPTPIRTYTEKELELAAQVAHEAIGGHGRGLGHNNVTLWKDSPQWQQERARACVREAVTGNPPEPTVNPTPLEKTQRRIGIAVAGAFLDAIQE